VGMKHFLLMIAVVAGGCASAPKTSTPSAQYLAKQRALLAALKIKSENGDAAAQFKLGMMYAPPYRASERMNNALGIIPGSNIIATKVEVVKEDGKEAAKWFRKAAEQNNADAQFYLGMLYMNGLGVMQDEKEGVKLIRKAAEQNNAEAQLNLGYLYDEGRLLKEDGKEAVKVYEYFFLARFM